MILQIKKLDPDAPILVVDIGNSSTWMARWHREAVTAQVSAPTHDADAVRGSFTKLTESFPNSRPAAVVVSAVVKSAQQRMSELVAETIEREALVIGQNIPIPIELEGVDPTTVGADRLCAAAAAYHVLNAPCIVVDFGTAVTVDLVSEEGHFLGGAILPGLQMQARALHEYTDALPQVPPGLPETPYGKNTIEAIQTGIGRGLAGSVRWLVEAYATALNRWPQVVATGGDLVTMAKQCDFLDSLVPDLTLRGVGLAHAKYLAERGV